MSLNEVQRWLFCLVLVGSLLTLILREFIIPLKTFDFATLQKSFGFLDEFLWQELNSTGKSRQSIQMGLISDLGVETADTTVRRLPPTLVTSSKGTSVATRSDGDPAKHEVSSLLRHLQIATTSIYAGNSDQVEARRILFARVVARVREYSAMPGVETVSLDVTTNDKERVHNIMRDVLPSSVRVSLNGFELGNRRKGNFMAAHEYRKKWRALSEDKRSNVTTFIYLEDDMELTPNVLLEWAKDQLEFQRVGLSSLCFQRGFLRYTKYFNTTTETVQPEFSDLWNLLANWNEFPMRNGHPVAACPKSWAPCSPAAEGSKFCFAFPFVVLEGKPGEENRVFATMRNPYSALQILSRETYQAWLTNNSLSGESQIWPYLIRETASCGTQFLERTEACSKQIQNWTTFVENIQAPKGKVFPSRMLVPVYLNNSSIFFNLKGSGVMHMGRRGNRNVSFADLGHPSREWPSSLHCPGLASPGTMFR